jgi:hypothetical protein
MILNEIQTAIRDAVRAFAQEQLVSRRSDYDSLSEGVG